MYLFICLFIHLFTSLFIFILYSLFFIHLYSLFIFIHLLYRNDSLTRQLDEKVMKSPLISSVSPADSPAARLEVMLGCGLNFPFHRKAITMYHLKVQEVVTVMMIMIMITTTIMIVITARRKGKIKGRRPIEEEKEDKQILKNAKQCG